MKAKCLNPSDSWICGYCVSKADGLVSPRLVFSFREAFEYWSKVYGPDLAKLRLGEHYVAQPCGRCAACQIRKRKEWTTRLTCESQMYKDNCVFITLTYDCDNVPVTDDSPFDSGDKVIARASDDVGLQRMTLHVPDVQKFLKRLRRHLQYQPKKSDGRDHVTTPIRYYCVGEYGGRTGRPHYHLLVFGWTPSDMRFWMRGKGHNICRSSQIEKLWRYGFSTVEVVGGGVAAYCSRYVTKKFARLNNDDPFRESILPEFVLQSVRNGGIGSRWFDKYGEDACRRGFVTVKTDRGFIKQSLPTYFWRRLRKNNLFLYADLRQDKILFAQSHKLLADDSVEELMRSVECYAENERRVMQEELL